MKFLLVCFLVGLGLAAAVPLVKDEHVSLEEVLAEELLNEVFFAEEDPKTELGRKLKEQFEEILEKLRDGIDKGKGLKEEYIQKLKDIREKLKELKIDLGKHAKDLLEKLKDKISDFWKNILEKLKPDNEAFYTEEEDEVKRDLRNRFNDLLEKIKDAIENRKNLGLNFLNKLKELYQEMKEKSIPMGEKAKELIEQLKEKATGIWKRILDWMSGGGNDSKRAIDEFHLLFANEIWSPEDFEIWSDDDNDVKTELGKKLKAHFEEILAKVKEMIETGKAAKDDLIEKLQAIRQKLRDMKIDIGDHAKDLINKLKQKAKDFWKKILDKLQPDHEAYYGDDDNDVKTELGKKLKAHFDELIEKMAEMIKIGKKASKDITEKAKEIRNKLKEMKIDISDYAKQTLKDLKKIAKDAWKKIVDALHPDDDKFYVEGKYADQINYEISVGQQLRTEFQELLEKLKEIVENGKTVKEHIIEKLVDLRQKLREMGIDVGDHAKELFQKLKEKAKDYWKKILDKLHPEHEVAYGDDDNEVKTELGKKLKAHFDEILEKVKEMIETGKEAKKDLVDKLQEIRQKLKDIKMDISDHAKQLLNKLKNKAKDFWKKLLDKLHPEKSVYYGDDDNEVKTELGKKLKAHFDEILEKVKEMIETGKEAKKDLVDKLQEIRQKLKDIKMDISDHAKQLLNKLKNKAKDFWKKLLDKLHPDKSLSYSADEEDEFKRNLRERFDDLLEKLKDAIENNKGIGKEALDKLLEIANMMKEKSISFGEKARVIIDHLKEKADAFFRDILEMITRGAAPEDFEIYYKKNL